MKSLLCKLRELLPKVKLRGGNNGVIYFDKNGLTGSIGIGWCPREFSKHKLMLLVAKTIRLEIRRLAREAVAK